MMHMEFAPYILNVAIVPLLSPLLIGIVRKVKAYMQNRAGASVLQPYRDLVKLYTKNEVISEDASWIFRVAPYVIFGITLALAAGVPLVGPLSTYLPTGDILVFAYLLAGGAFFLALAGMDTGSAFGGFGASREMMIAALTEGGLVLSLAGIAFMAGSTNFASIALALSHVSAAAYLPLALLAAAFSIALLAENARMPVDNPATHLELTMVHEAMILEYSGKRLALIEWAAANKLLIFIVVLCNVFFPWGTSVFGIGALVVTFAKIFVAAAGIALLESTIAKHRIFRLPDLLFTSFVISLIAIFIIVV